MRKLISILLAVILSALINTGVTTETTPPVTAQKGTQTPSTEVVESLPAEEKQAAVVLCTQGVAELKTPDYETIHTEATEPKTEATTQTESPITETLTETNIEASPPEIEPYPYVVIEDKSEPTDCKTVIADIAFTSETDSNEIIITAPITDDEPESSGVICVDEGDSNLAPYSPPPGAGTPNPFENAPPCEIVEIPVEDLLEPGDDRPGEGIHF
ncbi:MAG TPA: hypothetical protein PLT66_08005 [Bacillota bacterium]|nr:hypothetical protein [Bacillota bacterium]